MAATIPLWAIGKHITSVLLTPQTVNSTTGALSDTTPTAQFFGHTRSINLVVRYNHEELSAQNRPYDNMVPISQGTRLRLQEMEKSNANSNLAAAQAFGATYWKYTLIRGGNTFVGFGVLGQYEMDSPGKGGVNATFELEPIDVGTDSPITYT